MCIRDRGVVVRFLSARLKKLAPSLAAAIPSLDWRSPQHRSPRSPRLPPRRGASQLAFAH
eukprot:1121237-Alexandrium_andersonii.AAC.1